MTLFKIITIVFYLLAGHLLAEEVGSLLVTYQTGSKGERIDRIRFRLESNLVDHPLHPRKNGYVDDPKLFARTVAIEKLPAGTYTLHFLLPNKDGYFEEVPSRTILISENKTLKIDQQIKPTIRQNN